METVLDHASSGCVVIKGSHDGLTPQDFIDHIARCKEFREVRDLSLSHDALACIANIALCTNLRRVSLRNCNLNNIDALRSLAQVEQLDVAHNSIDDIPTNAKWIMLTKCDLSYNAIETVARLQGLACALRLKQLQVMENPFVEHDAFTLITECLPQLFELNGVPTRPAMDMLGTRPSMEPAPDEVPAAEHFVRFQWPTAGTKVALLDVDMGGFDERLQVLQATSCFKQPHASIAAPILDPRVHSVDGQTGSPSGQVSPPHFSGDLNLFKHRKGIHSVPTTPPGAMLLGRCAEESEVDSLSGVMRERFGSVKPATYGDFGKSLQDESTRDSVMRRWTAPFGCDENPSAPREMAARRLVEDPVAKKSIRSLNAPGKAEYVARATRQDSAERLLLRGLSFPSHMGSARGEGGQKQQLARGLSFPSRVDSVPHESPLMRGSSFPAQTNEKRVDKSLHRGSTLPTQSHDGLCRDDKGQMPLLRSLSPPPRISSGLRERGDEGVDRTLAHTNSGRCRSLVRGSTLPTHTNGGLCRDEPERPSLQSLSPPPRISSGLRESDEVRVDRSFARGASFPTQTSDGLQQDGKESGERSLTRGSSFPSRIHSGLRERDDAVAVARTHGPPPSSRPSYAMRSHSATPSRQSHTTSDGWSKSAGINRYGLPVPSTSIRPRTTPSAPPSARRATEGRNAQPVRSFTWGTMEVSPASPSQSTAREFPRSPNAGAEQLVSCRNAYLGGAKVPVDEGSTCDIEDLIQKVENPSPPISPQQYSSTPGGSLFSPSARSSSGGNPLSGSSRALVRPSELFLDKYGCNPYDREGTNADVMNPSQNPNFPARSSVTPVGGTESTSSPSASATFRPKTRSLFSSGFDTSERDMSPNAWNASSTTQNDSFPSGMSSSPYGLCRPRQNAPPPPVKPLSPNRQLDVLSARREASPAPKRNTGSLMAPGGLASSPGARSALQKETGWVSNPASAVSSPGSGATFRARSSAAYRATVAPSDPEWHRAEASTAKATNDIVSRPFDTKTNSMIKQHEQFARTLRQCTTSPSMLQPRWVSTTESMRPNGADTHVENSRPNPAQHIVAPRTTAAVQRQTVKRLASKSPVKMRTSWSSTQFEGFGAKVKRAQQLIGVKGSSLETVVSALCAKVEQQQELLDHFRLLTDSPRESTSKQTTPAAKRSVSQRCFDDDNSPGRKTAASVIKYPRRQFGSRADGRLTTNGSTELSVN